MENCPGEPSASLLNLPPTVYHIDCFSSLESAKMSTYPRGEVQKADSGSTEEIKEGISSEDSLLYPDIEEPTKMQGDYVCMQVADQMFSLHMMGFNTMMTQEWMLPIFEHTIL
jgi:hypothetical protein